MKLLGNIIWLVFGGLVTAGEYFLASIPFFVSIIGIPFGIQAVKIGILELWPFGSEVVKREESSGCLYSVMNIVWIFIGGIWICLTHIVLGILLGITIIGIPFAKQHFKLAALSLAPFGKDIIVAKNL